MINLHLRYRVADLIHLRLDPKCDQIMDCPIIVNLDLRQMAYPELAHSVAGWGRIWAITNNSDKGIHQVYLLLHQRVFIKWLLHLP